MESKIIITPESIVTILETMLCYHQLLEDSSNNHSGLCSIYRKSIADIFYPKKPQNAVEYLFIQLDIREFTSEKPFWNLTPYLTKDIAHLKFGAQCGTLFWWDTCNFKSRRAFLEFALKKARKDIHLEHKTLMIKKTKSFVGNLFNKLK